MKRLPLGHSGVKVTPLDQHRVPAAAGMDRGSKPLDLEGAGSRDLPVMTVTEPGPPSAKRLSVSLDDRGHDTGPASPSGPRRSRPYSHRALDFGPDQTGQDLANGQSKTTSHSSGDTVGSEPAVRVLP